MSNKALRRQRISGDDTDDQRSRFERDRDRILYTHAFRRLGGVTQVARANEAYTYHDRLSHSLKVAQISRRLAEYFQSDPGPKIPNGISVNPDVVETAALAHDIGHPPFGHAAEEELNKKISREKNVDDGFEGNAQSFRIVTRLATYAPDKAGLDLTLASLNALLKYPWRKGTGMNRWGVDESNKWGVYESDVDAFEEARKLSSVNKRRSAEADIMDWADDLAYAVHDMEDFYKSGIIPLNELLSSGSQERDRFVEDWSGSSGTSTDEANDILDFIDDISGDSLRTPYNGTELERYDLKELSSKLISRYLGAEAGGVSLQNRRSTDNHLQIEQYLENEVGLLKHMAIYYVINDGKLVTQQRGQREIISDLFDILFNATLPDSSRESENRRIIPGQFRERAEKIEETGDKQSRCRLTADIITSMTEKQATQLHKRLIGSTPGSLQEHIFD